MRNIGYLQVKAIEGMAAMKRGLNNPALLLVADRIESGDLSRSERRHLAKMDKRKAERTKQRYL
jgi:hypothetical protein